MADSDLVELMGDARANEKSPHIYEAAFTEWAKRQPDVEPEPDPPWPDGDPFPDVDRGSVRVELLELELAAHSAQMADPDGLSDAELQQVIDYAFILDDLLAYEQRLAAVDVPDVPEADPATAGNWLDNRDVDTFVVDPVRAKRHAIQAQAWELSETGGISYYEALARVQDVPIERVYRDEFLDLMQRENGGVTSYKKAVATLHSASIEKWERDMEAATNGYFYKREFSGEGLAPADLWTMNQVTADKYMSDEARDWFDEHGRVTMADLRDMIDRGLVTSEPDAVLETFGQIGDDVRSRRKRPKRRRKTAADRRREALLEAAQEAADADADSPAETPAVPDPPTAPTQPRDLAAAGSQARKDLR